MKLTTAQVVMVAKDRVVDELNNLVGTGYWTLDAKTKKQVKKLALMISMPEDSKETLKALKNFVNGEEGDYYGVQKGKTK